MHVSALNAINERERTGCDVNRMHIVVANKRWIGSGSQQVGWLQVTHSKWGRRKPLKQA